MTQKLPRVRGLLKPDMARQYIRRGQAIQWEDRVALAALFVHIGAVAGSDIEMFFLGHLQQRAIHARIEFVVDIRKREIFAAGGGEAGIARDRDAPFSCSSTGRSAAAPAIRRSPPGCCLSNHRSRDQFIAVQLLLFNALKELR